ncbi:GntR family transcriptional regulator [Zoogloea sp.]|jgi:DNA-binding GntR family transcriptional regulator|uniref:GntR family transcriptional regulator n=1 Tax=Zoogloea sp. TaxID=49181 RepID=UPI0035B2242F
MNDLATVPDVSGNHADEPKTLAEAAYRQLRRDIIEGVHRPGDKLRVEHLKDQYAVGAGTLREALQLLVTDALVVAQGQRGFRVAPISLDDFEDITRTRVLLETVALQQSIELGDDTWEANVVASFHMLSRAEEKLVDGTNASREEWELRNRAFHEVLISASTSRWVRHFQNILYLQSERYRRLSLFRQPISRDVHAEHQAIVDAALARNAKEATRILTEHILRTLEAVRNLPADLLS